jgi:ABC-type transport system substrate-binding protein
MIGTRLGDRYEVLAELGRGGMGVVYRAKDPVLNREVAVKLIPPGNLTKDAEERFQREAQIVAQMDHPAVVPIYDFGRHEGALFFVMPVLPGTNLRHLLRDRSLRLGDVLDVGVQVAEALDYSHARGIVHRDIKPENIMTAREEGGGVRARVMDFGLALATSEDRLTKTGTLVGTVSYFSPEQITARTFDGRSDVYALGTVLYECLAGEPPFTGEVQSVLYRIAHEVPPSLRAMGVDVAEGLQEIVFQCLEKDPEKRPRRAGHVAEALRRYRSSLHEDEFTRSVILNSSRVLPRPAASAPFIGREKELAELQRRLHAAVAGECQFAVVAGEPGIGKTRLLDELKALGRARKIAVLQGRFVEHDRAFAHQGFCELIQDYFRTRDTGSSAASRPDFSDLAADLLALFPVLSEIGDLRTTAGDSAAGRGPEGRKAEDRIAVFELIARTLTRIGGGRPLLLVLEELHGAELSIEALQYIVRRLGPTPTLIVGTYRQTEIDKRHPLVRMLESFRGDPRFASITLGPLTPSEHRALAQQVAGAGRLSDGLATRLFDATEGNPLFTKELVRSLVDSGGIAADDSGALNLSGAAGISSDALPETIQQAVEARIERLPENLREMIAVASVLGRGFEFRELETLVEGPDLEDAVDALVKEGILEEERESRGDRLVFASGIMRDVLYGRLSRRKRKSLHRKYADLLERRNAGRLERIYPELLHHFSEADVPDKAVEYALKQARKSLESFSAEEAMRVARTALEYLEDEEWEGDRAEEGEARLLLSRAAQMAGHLDTALREAEAASRVFEREKKPGRAAAASLSAAESAWQGRRVDETRRWVERGIESAAAAGSAEPLSRLLSLAITVANLRGEYQQAAAYQAQLERLAPSQKAVAEEIPAGGRLVVGLANPVAATEPGEQQTIEEAEVLACVFETLLTTDAEGSLAPNLCVEWSLRDGGRTARLKLRQGVRFSDGAPLDAAAVRASIERAVRARHDGLPAALEAIQGTAEFLAGTAPTLAGVALPADDVVEFALREPLPIFPALLTDTIVAVTRTVPEEAGGKERVLGTGPFRIAAHTPERVLLERNPHAAKDRGARLDAIEFRTSLSASAIAAQLRAGELDVVRDLAPHDLEEILREPRFRAGLVEVPKKNTYFAVFNTKRGPGANPDFRRALAGVVRSQDFVWGALGRFAVPATGILPPGILGHDPGRRRALLPREQAVGMVEASGVAPPWKLAAAVHPTLQDRYRALTGAVWALWRDLGVEVESAAPSMEGFLDAWSRNDGIDMLVGRWSPDYDDPDNFTLGLFHSAHGLLKSYYSSLEVDRLVEEARLESRPSVRETLYRRVERILLDDAVIVPFFHDVDFRVTGAGVRGLELGNTAPFVNYMAIGKTASGPAPAARPREGGGVVTATIAGTVLTIDPPLVYTGEQIEVAPNVFETLTRDVEGARIVPWLASEVLSEEGGTRFRFRLRKGVRFHDGRALTARDVRFSFERHLQNAESESRWLLAPIRGARALAEGKVGDLEGFRIVSPGEFTVELERPLSLFPAVVSHPSTAVVPEGTVVLGPNWREGCVGTGAFRVVRFEPGKRLELERNPDYWREGFPLGDGLVFRFGVSPEEIRSEFLAGRLSIAADLLPADAESLRNDARFASGYRESPRLSTYYAAFNVHRGPFTDVALRRRVFDGFDAAALVRRTLGRGAIPASGLIPPGLLGFTPGLERGARAAGPPLREPLEVTAAVHPIFFGEYAAFWKELLRAFRELGVVLKPATKTMAEYLTVSSRGETDIDIGRWLADFPDADTFVHGAGHSQMGSLGRYVGRPETDALAERGRAEADPGIRHALYRQFEEILARDAILIPLFHEQNYRFARPEVEGLSVGLTTPVVSYESLRIRR